MNEGSALDVRELLRRIAEQQASLVKLQQLALEHVLWDPNRVSQQSILRRRRR